MRLYISADIEGIVHVTSAIHTTPAGSEYEPARRWMTDSVLAVAEAAHGLGFAEVVVADSHGNGQNILPDALPPYVQLVRGWPRPLSMMQGIEVGSYEAAMLVGYHTGSMTPGGYFAHNFSGAMGLLRVNGEIWTETHVSAAIAGHFGVPVVLASGDDIYCREAAALLGEVETVAVKTATGRHSGLNLAPPAAYQRLREGAARALSRRQKFKPWRAEGPLSVEVAFRSHLQAEVLSLLSGIERTGAHDIALTVADILELTRFIEFLGHYDLARFR
jgi:D-amino peptidase